MRREYPSPIEHAVSSEAEAAFQSRLLALLAAPGIKLRRIAALLDAELYLIEEKTRKGSVLRFDVRRYAHDQRSAGRFSRLPDTYRPTQDVILPPGDGEIHSGEGGEPYRETEVIHRTRAVIDLLSQMSEPYDLIDGTTTERMVRRLSYVAFVLKERRKLLLVNDEERNATYVIHFVQNDRETQEYLRSRKDDLRDLQERHPELVSVLEFRGSMESYVEDLRELIERPYAAEPSREEAGEEADAAKKEDSTAPADREEEAILPAPEGWMTSYSLRKVLHKSNEWIQSRLAELTPVEGRDVRMCLNSNGQQLFHYSPEMFQRLLDLAHEHERAPEGWMTIRSLAKILKKSENWIQTRIKELTLIAEVDVRRYLTEAHHTHVHYSPKIVRRLRELAREYEQAPEGWMTMTGIKQQTGLIYARAERFMQSLSPVQGKDVRSYFGVHNNQLAPHYSPEIIARLRELAQKKYEHAPEGWMTIHRLVSVLEKSPIWIGNKLKELTPTEGRDVKSFLDASNKPASHYSPEMVRRLRELAQEYERAPDGWMTAGGLMALGKSQAWISQRMTELSLVEGRDVKTYLDRTGHPVLHYGPEIVWRLQELATEHEQAPEGWVTRHRLTQVVSKSEGWLRKRLGGLAPVEGRDVKTYLDSTGHRVLHYSPEMVRRLQELAEEYKRAPQGWVTAKSLRRVLKKSEEWIQRKLKELTLIKGRDVAMYLDEGGHVCSHYSPTIVDRLQKMTSEKNV